MDALLPAFLAALLGQWGDKTQLLAALLAARFGRPAPILAGIAAAALANSILSAIGGSIAAELIPFRAATMMLALALLFAGMGALWPHRSPPDVNGIGGVVLASATSFFLVQFGDTTQFLTFAIAAHSGSPTLTAAGATAGIVTGVAPAVLLGRSLEATMPLRPIRIATAILFVLGGTIAALIALRLV